MTTSQINQKYDRGFLMVITSNGEEGSEHPLRCVKFAYAKKTAISYLSATLDRHHGRGEHTVALYGLTLVNTTTPEEHRVGFGPNWVETRDELLFTL